MQRKEKQQATKQSTQNKVCAFCGEDNEKLLEKHHVFGRNTSPEILDLCKNCHYLITLEQNKINPRRRSKKAAKTDLEAFAFVSVGALFSVMGEILTEAGKIYYRDIKEG